MEAGDPFSIIRRFWAANNILQNPDDMREWETLPSDVMDHVLAVMDKRNMASMRLVCKAWNSCVNRSVSNLQLCVWPPRSSFLSDFTSLTSVSLHCPAIPTAQQRIETITPLLLRLAALPRLQDLSLTHAGPGSLDTLEVLTGLTSLAIQKPSDTMYTNRSSTASGEEQDGNVDADADADAAAVAGAIGGVPNWVLPGAAEDDLNMPMVAAAADAVHAAYPTGGYAAMAAATVHPAHPAARSKGSSNDDSGLPASMVKLQLLEKLVLESINPDPNVLGQLKALKRLELRGRTPRLRDGLLVAANPLPGVGVLTGLTCLIARCNYGISRLPADLGALRGLKHLDVSKNMLWGLPPQMTQLSSLEYLDLSSNCMSVLPSDISALQSLTYLDVSNNSRVSLPHSLAQLSNLVQLNCSWIWSDLTVLWQGSAGFSRLQSLNVVGNGVAELPASVGGFKALTQLSLSMNNLSSLPESIGKVSSLAALELSDNRLATLPGSIGQLGKLATLSLRSNCLPGLPEEVGGLSSLTYLDISMNHVETLPDSMSRLTSLTQLALSMNPLQRLPAGLSALQNLKILEMYYVCLSEGQTTSDTGLTRLQELIPGLYIFSNTLFPYDNNGEDNPAADRVQQQQFTASSSRLPQVVTTLQQQHSGLRVSVPAAPEDVVMADDGAQQQLQVPGAVVEQPRLLSLLLSPQSSNRSASTDATGVISSGGSLCISRYLGTAPARQPSSAPTDATGVISSGRSLCTSSISRYLSTAPAGQPSSASTDATGVISSGRSLCTSSISRYLGTAPAGHPSSHMSVASSVGSMVSGGSSSSRRRAYPQSWPVPAAAAAGDGCFGLGVSLLGCTSSEPEDSDSWIDEPDTVKVYSPSGPVAAGGASPSRDQGALPAQCNSRGNLRATFAPGVADSSVAAADSSAGASSSDSRHMSWCQQLGGASAGSWPCLAAAASSSSLASASAQSQPLQGTWSCDLGLLAAATAAAGASAAAASGAEVRDRLMPLRPLSKAHSVGRPLLSRYSRGGEAGNSPTGQYSGYGLAASHLLARQNLDVSVRCSESSTVEAAGVAQQHGGRIVAPAAPEVAQAGGRRLRRMTAYGDDEAADAECW